MITMTTCRGLISKVIDGERTVIIDLPKGGSIRAPNMGAFEIGDEVCFTLDVTGRRVVIVMSREMAEWYDARAENEMMQLALKEDQHGAILFVNDDPDNGQTIEIAVDRSHGEPGEVDSGGGDNSVDEHLYANSDGAESESGVSTEGSIEADSVLVPVLLGHDYPEEMGYGSGESVDAGRAHSFDAEGD
jgi:hypothetical protein